MTLGVVLLCPEWINKIGILSDRICLSFVLGGLSRDFRTHQHTNITHHTSERDEIEDGRRRKSRIHRARELDGRLKEDNITDETILYSVATRNSTTSTAQPIYYIGRNFYRALGGEK